MLVILSQTIFKKAPYVRVQENVLLETCSKLFQRPCEKKKGRQKELIHLKESRMFVAFYLIKTIVLNYNRLTQYKCDNIKMSMWLNCNNIPIM